MDAVSTLQLENLPLPVLITIGLVMGVRYIGIWRGEKTAAEPHSAQVVSMIVDPTTLNRHAEAVLKLSQSMAEIGEILTKISLQMEISRAVEGERNRQEGKRNDRNDRLDRER